MAAYPVRIDDSASQGAPPDPLDHPEFYEGIVTRRIAAHLLDALLILLLIGGLGFALIVLGVLTFGLLWIPLVFLGIAIPLAYDTLQVGGRRAATIGMRAFGLEVRSWTGGHPLRPQALLRAVLFWGMSYYTAAVMMWLLLGVALFNRRRRCLHDYFSGTLVIRCRKLMVLEPRSG